MAREMLSPHRKPGLPGVSVWGTKLRIICRQAFSEHGPAEPRTAAPRYSIVRGGVYAAGGAFFRRENPIYPGEKKASLQILRPEALHLKQNLKGDVLKGDLSPFKSSF